MELEHRRWMYNRNYPNRGGLREEFVQGVDGFIAQAMSLPLFEREGMVRCPCVNCKCKNLVIPEIVVNHLYRRGFISNYYVCTRHGEIEGSDRNMGCSNYFVGESSHSVDNNSFQGSRLHEMVRDAFGMNSGFESEQDIEQAPNEEAQYFYDQLEAASRPLCEGSKHSELSVVVRLLSIRSYCNVSQVGMNSMIGLMSELVDPDINLPHDYYRAKKLVSKLGLSSMKIDCCKTGCMLYYKDDANLEYCKLCEQPRFKQSSSGKKIPFKYMHYLPLIPRLKRLYASMSSAPHMRWHYEKRRPPGIMCHPSDGEAWKHFDRTYPDFANEPRNISLGLCADGFTPFSNSATPYSCWPVFVTPYNLPPDMCMTSPYIFLTCIIPGPKNPKSLIDIYLQHLIDELKILWNEGVLTYDISTKQNFNLRASLVWTINDFPEFLEKSAQAKKARASEKGGSLYCGGGGGGKPQSAWKKELEVKHGGKLPFGVLFQETHTKKRKPEEGEGAPVWGEALAGITHKAYTRRMEDYIQNKGCNEQGEPYKPSDEEEIGIWLEVCGGVYKGRAYGLSSERSFHRLNSGLRGIGASSDAEALDRDTLENMQQKIARLNEELQAIAVAREADRVAREAERVRLDDDMAALKSQIKHFVFPTLMNLMEIELMVVKGWSYSNESDED